VSRSYFQTKFRSDPCLAFAEAIERLRGWGHLSVNGDVVTLNREGLLQVDRLLHEFFLPEHRGGRYA
jgi:oxygen-independent coproporphyrinogen-3 oxidase